MSPGDVLVGRGFLAITSLSHTIPIGSRHMSVVPILFWSPGTQTQSFVPARRTLRLPSRSISATVASLVIQSGPASMARLIFSRLISSAVMCSSDALCILSYMTLLPALSSLLIIQADADRPAALERAWRQGVTQTVRGVTE